MARSKVDALTRTEDECIDGFLHHIEVDRGLSFNTMIAYRSDLQLFERYLRRYGMTIVNATRNDLEDYLRFLQTEGQSNATVQRKLACLRVFYRHLQSLDVIESDPSQGVVWPRLPRGATHRRILSQDQVTKLLNVPGTGPLVLRDRALLELLYRCKLRVSEAISLDLGDFDPTDSVLQVGRGSSRRLELMGARTVEEMNRYLDRGRPIFIGSKKHSRLIVGISGSPLTRQGVSKIIGRLSQSILGIHISPETLRRTRLEQEESTLEL